MSQLKGNPLQYTEEELRMRGVGEILDVQENRWKIKKATFINEGVWTHFLKLRSGFTELLPIAKGGISSVMAESCAQTVMDRFLILRSQGLEGKIPKQVIVVSEEPKEKKKAEEKDDKDKIRLYDAKHFGDRKNVTANEEVRWIFANIKKKGVKESEAPSLAAFAEMMDLRENTELYREYRRTMLPKLMTKEEAEKGGKLMDSGKKTIELIDRLLAAVGGCDSTFNRVFKKGPESEG